MRKLFTLTALLSLVALAAAAAPKPSGASAQTQPPTEFQYAAKLVCGRADAASGGLAAPGQYYTIVNVHNPSPNREVKFRKKFARALPGEKAGKITPFFPAALRADEAMGIDCPDMYKHTGITPGTFFEGYVVLQIMTPMELDVVSVYTAGAPNVATLHSERVPARRIPYVPPQSCGDLNQNLSTGVAAWSIKSEPPSNSPVSRTASLVTAPHSAWGSIPGAQWIGPAPNSSQGGAPGKYVYETCFCLCSGFSNAQLTLKGFADNSASVFLNGHPQSLGQFGSFYGTAGTAQTNDQTLFKPGTNCVQVEVNNWSGPTGLIVSGSVTAAGGKCPSGITDATDTQSDSQ
ncbi:MAG TPA: hypothetical protein VER32_15235 [Pyrinomonadaceae bacterium]|nr:hypothetical protein [Pyrinomonadaceae bacterium]